MTRRVRTFLVALPFLATPCCVSTTLPATRVYTLGADSNWQPVSTEPGQWAPTFGHLYGPPQLSESYAADGQPLFVRYDVEWLKLGFWIVVHFAIWALLSMGTLTYLRRRAASEPPRL